MKLAKIFLPGRFEDAFIYMGWLIALTEDRTFRMFNLEQIANKIDASSPQLAPIATFLFARNDWLNSGQFKSLMCNPSIKQQFCDLVDGWPPNFDISNFCESFVESQINVQSPVILDMKCYNTRLYLGTSDGVYDLQVNWNEARVESNVRKRLDCRCLTLSTGYGAINASCGNEGLFSGIQEFGTTLNQSAELKQCSDRSVRTGWMGYNIVNYRTNVSPFLFKTKHEKGDEENNSFITEIEAVPSDMDFVYDTLQSRYGLNRNSVQFTFNSNNYLFLHTLDGDFYSVQFKSEKSAGQNISFTKTHKGAQTRILSASPLKGGHIIEAEDRVLLFAGDEWNMIVNSPALMVRTFATSKRFQNLVAVTTEDGIWLVSEFNENEY